MVGSHDKNGGGGDAPFYGQQQDAAAEVTKRRFLTPLAGQGKEANGNNSNGNSTKSAVDRSTGLLEEYAVFVFTFRMLAIAVWTGGVIYSSYRIYVEADELMPFFVEPENNAGPLTPWLGRSWDHLDFEWNLLAPILWTKLIPYFILYKVLESFTINLGYLELSTWVSPAVSFLMVWKFVSFNGALIFYAAPVLYWLLMRLRSKIAIWSLTILFIIVLNTPVVPILLSAFDNNYVHLFNVFFAWNLSRSVSFCFDVWDRPEQQKCSVEYLGNFIKYIGYVPLIPSGPLVLFHHFENKILKKDLKTLVPICFNDVLVTVKKLVKLFVITAVFVLLQYFLYYRPLAYTGAPIYQMSLWAVCGSIYWLGQSFSLKYKILYGIPSALSELDGLDMYPLPCCPAYVHRYSALWKDFDRGLYLFLVRYIYIPIVKWFNQVDPHNKVNSEVRKLVASLGTFGYIFVWHSITYEVFVWTALNFLGVTIERIGSTIKKKIDRIHRMDPLVWDFIIEPLITVPLAAMSIVNSSVFCGGLGMATSFTHRLWISRSDNYAAWLFLYCFTHAGVTVRTWPALLSALKPKLHLRQDVFKTK